VGSLFPLVRLLSRKKDNPFLNLMVETDHSNERLRTTFRNYGIVDYSCRCS
jgi:hypothetical protein